MNSTPKAEPRVSITGSEARQRLARGESATDWQRVEAIPDEAIGTDDPDASPMSAAELEAAPIRRRPGQRGAQKAPTKERVTLRLSADVLAYFRAEGPGWQTRIDAALRDWIAGRH